MGVASQVNTVATHIVVVLDVVTIGGYSLFIKCTQN